MSGVDDFLDQYTSKTPVSGVLSVDDFLNQNTPDTLVQAQNAGMVGSAPSGASILKGMRDPVDAGAQLLAHSLPESVTAGANNMLGDFAPKPEQMDKQLQDAESLYQQQRVAGGETGTDWARLGGNMISTIPLSMVAPEVTGPSLLAKLGRVGVGTGAGATFGALTPVANEGDDFWKQKQDQTTVGAATGGVLSPLAGFLSRIIKPNTSKEVTDLMKEGITPTPGQILGGGWKATEEKATSIPLLGEAIKSGQRRAMDDLNIAAYNRALSPIREKYVGDAGRHGIEQVADKLGAAYDYLLPKLQFKPDNSFSADIKNISDMAIFLPKQQANQFKSIVGTQLNKLKNGADGETLKGIESELRGQAKGYMSDTSFDNRKLGSAIDEVTNAIRANLQRSNPIYAERLANINKGWANYSILRNASSKLGANEGVFTPSQLQAAVRASDKSVAKGNFAKGNALMQDLSEPAKSVLGNQYPDSGSIGRALLTGVAGLATGGASSINPGIPMAIGGAMIPYSKLGQKMMATLLAKRPDIAKPIAEGVAKSYPWLASGATPFFTQGTR